MLTETTKEVTIMFSQLIHCIGASPCEFVQKNVASVICCGGYAHSRQEPETEDFYQRP